jgi:hypothetical protein
MIASMPVAPGTRAFVSFFLLAGASVGCGVGSDKPRDLAALTGRQLYAMVQSSPADPSSAKLEMTLSYDHPPGECYYPPGASATLNGVSSGQHDGYATMGGGCAFPRWEFALPATNAADPVGHFVLGDATLQIVMDMDTLLAPQTMSPRAPATTDLWATEAIRFDLSPADGISDSSIAFILDGQTAPSFATTAGVQPDGASFAYWIPYDCPPGTGIPCPSGSGTLRLATDGPVHVATCTGVDKCDSFFSHQRTLAVTLQEPSPCATGADCHGALPFCDTTGGSCAVCLVDADCPAGIPCETSGTHYCAGSPPAP